MSEFLLLASAAGIVLTGVAHSFFGERRLIAPALADRRGIYASHLARAVTRFAWHLSTAIAFVLAALIVLIVRDGGDRLVDGTALIVGGVLLAAGLIDAVMSRGKHIGWPMLTGAGVLALASLLF